MRLITWTLVSALLLGTTTAAAQSGPRTFNMCVGDDARLRDDIGTREQRAARSCEPVIANILAMVQAKRSYARALFDAARGRALDGVRVFDDELEPLRDLVRIHNEIGVEAAAANVLLDARTAALVDAARGKAPADGQPAITPADIGPVMFGIPVAAMSFDVAEIETANQLRGRHDANYVEMENFARDYPGRAGALLEQANAALDVQLREMAGLFDAFEAQRGALRRAFDSREFEHCLGTPLEDNGTAGSVPVSADGKPIPSVEFAPVGEQRGTRFDDLPGITPGVSTLSEARQLLPPFRLPPPPVGLPAELAFKRDGRFISAEFIEGQRELLRAELALQRAQTLEALVGFVPNTVKYVGELGGKLVTGSAQAIYEPFARNFSDKSQGILSAAANSLFDIGAESLEGVVRSASNLIGDALDVLSPNGLLIARESEAADRAARENNSLRAGLATATSYFTQLQANLTARADTLATLEALTSDDVPADLARESALEAVADLARKRESLADAREAAAARDRALKVLEGRAFDALTVLTARSGFRGVVNRTRNLVGGTTDLVRDLRTNLRIANELDRIETLRRQAERGSPVQAQLDRARDELARLQRERPPAGQGIVLERPIGESAAARALREESAQKRQRQRAFEPGRDPNQGTPIVAATDSGAPVKVGQFIAAGGFKQVFESADPTAVIQRFARKKNQSPEQFQRALNEELARDRVAGERLERAGIRTVKERPLVDADGKPLVDEQGGKLLTARDETGALFKSVERVAPDTIASALIKQQGGKLTPEQFAAVAETVRKATDNNLLLVDFKPSNIALDLDGNGRLAATVIDKDAVVDIDALRRERASNPALVKAGETPDVIVFEGARFDLSDPAGVRKLQSLIVDGPSCCPEISTSGINAQIALARQAVLQELTSRFITSTDNQGGRASGFGTFRAAALEADGKPTRLVDFGPERASAVLDDARDTRISERTALGDTLKERANRIRERAVRVEELSGDLDALANISASKAAAKTTPTRPRRGGAPTPTGAAPTPATIPSEFLEPTEEQEERERTNAQSSRVADTVRALFQQRTEAGDGFPSGR